MARACEPYPNERSRQVGSHSFIVKIWLEQTQTEEEHATIWRGHITHVPGGERRYVRDLNQITAFIIPYLNAMGANLGIWQRIRTSLWR